METKKTSRDIIMDRILMSQPDPVERPYIPMFTVEGDPLVNFITHLQNFDGSAIMFKSRRDALEWLQKNIDTGNKRVYSSLPDYSGNVNDAEVADPHAANVVDVCVANGLLGVGETGSIYVTDESLGLAACALFSTDLYLLLDKTKIVDGMHTAYRDIDLTDNHYGSFFTGPSATADIEAVHITGAQGEITLTALLY
ncbi:MAG: LUD domain-containing protein [Duncaniella sp.]|nr:LUD domain-containing protein [Muribaculum sp.]MCM1255051.1 LUD domain-containing protein [Duncaniella sp.]